MSNRIRAMLRATKRRGPVPAPRFVLSRRNRTAGSVAGTLFCLVMVAASPAARANPLDTYGFTARAIAMGGGLTAAAEHYDAVYYNMAGMAALTRLTAGAGVLVSHAWRQINGRDQPSDWLTMLQVGLAAPLPLGQALQRRIFAGLVVSAPADVLYQVDLPDDRQAYFPMLGSRNRRLVLMGGLAGRIFDWWQVGVGVVLLPAVRANVLVDLKAQGGLNTASIAVDYNVMAVAGMKFRPADWLDIGLTYRGGHHARLDLSPVRVDVAENLDPVQAQITAPIYATPHELALGVAVRPHPDITLALDVTWSHFADWQVSSPEVVLCSACPRDCAAGNCPDYCLSDACVPVFTDHVKQPSFSDTFTPRGGIEWRPVAGLALRTGYGFVQSPTPAQTGTASLIDGHRHIVALGAGYRFDKLPPFWPAVIAFDAHVQVQVLPETGWAKDTTDADDDGTPDLYVAPRSGAASVWPTISGAAVLLDFGLDVRMEF